MAGLGSETVIAGNSILPNEKSASTYQILVAIAPKVEGVLNVSIAKIEEAVFADEEHYIPDSGCSVWIAVGITQVRSQNEIVCILGKDRQID